MNTPTTIDQAYGSARTALSNAADVAKFNSNHDQRGRFASSSSRVGFGGYAAQQRILASGSSSGNKGKPPKPGALSDKEFKQTHKEFTSSAVKYNTLADKINRLYTSNRKNADELIDKYQAQSQKIGRKMLGLQTKLERHQKATKKEVPGLRQLSIDEYEIFS